MRLYAECVSDIVPPKRQTKSNSSLAQSCNSYFHLQYSSIGTVYLCITVQGTPQRGNSQAIPSSTHPPLVRRSTQAARLIISSLIGSPISVKMLIKSRGTIERNGRTFLQDFELRDVQEVIFALRRISPIRWSSLPMTTFLSASRFGVPMASRFGGPNGQTALCYAFCKGERVG
jgi:hypothetical protein